MKNAILSNIDSVLGSDKGVNDVAHAVLEKEITEDELKATGKYSDVYKQKIDDRVNELIRIKKEDDAWEIAKKNGTQLSYQTYINSYPKGKYVDEANAFISLILNANSAATKARILEDLAQNINMYSISELKQAGVSLDDIKNVAGIHVPEEILDILEKDSINLQIGGMPQNLAKGRTEVYFWGTPGSGKTCALAAILSAIKMSGFYTDVRCNGALYMDQLANIFRSYRGAATLPLPTPVEVTQELAFDLQDENHRVHPITLIELSGEIFRCLYYVQRNIPVPEVYAPAFRKTLEFLQSNENPKLHFFVIDVNNDTVDDMGLCQDNYLQAATAYFKANKILNSRTAGIYILVTKSDKLSDDLDERKKKVIQKLKCEGTCYFSFCNALRDIAYRCKLIPKKDSPLPVVPFSIGNVYFKEKCKFDKEASVQVMRILQDNTAKR